MLAKPCPQWPTPLASTHRSGGMGAIRLQHLVLGIALAVISAGCGRWRPPVVVKVVSTINNGETISSSDYEQLREITEEAIDHIRSMDPHIRPQLTLSSQKNFVDEIADQTRSGRCIRWNGPPPRRKPTGSAAPPISSRPKQTAILPTTQLARRRR